MEKLIIPTNKSMSFLFDVREELNSLNTKDINDISVEDSPENTTTIVEPFFHPEWEKIKLMKYEDINILQDIRNSEIKSKYNYFLTIIINSVIDKNISDKIKFLLEKHKKCIFTYILNIKSYKSIERDLFTLNSLGVRNAYYKFILHDGDGDFIDKQSRGNKNILKSTLRKFLNKDDIKKSLFENSIYGIIKNSKLYQPNGFNLETYFENQERLIDEVSKRLE